MPWLSILQIVLGILFRRRNQASQAATAQFQQESQNEERELAQKIVEAAPQLNFDCVLREVPGLLQTISGMGAGLFDYTKLIPAVIPHVINVVRCQLGINQAEATNNTLNCAIQAGLIFFQTRNAQQAIATFIGCLLGGGTVPPPITPPPVTPPPVNPPPITPPPGGGGGGTGPGPTQPTFREVPRC